MNESHPPHPSDDDLSAAIDGLDEAGVGAHVAGCSRCSYRMEAMRDVADALAVAPVVDQVARERQIAAAVRLRPDRSRRRVWLGAAAAVLVLLVALPLVVNRGGDGDETLAGGPARFEGAATDAATVAMADLGAFSDPAALRAALAPRVGEELFDVQRSAGEALSGDVAVSGGAGGPCYQQAEGEYGDRVGDLIFTASLTWENQPAVVLVYPLSSSRGALDKLALVFRRTDCILLTSVSM